MNPAGIDLVKCSKLISQQIDHVTCVECCKYYIASETAACGHTLCHNCWRARRSCPLCTLPVERKQIKLNQPKQKLTEHIQLLGETFEKLFKLKLAEFELEIDEMESENDPSKNVKDWLASSQNQFSAPGPSSDLPSLELKQNANIEISSKIQDHTPTKKTVNPEKIIHVSIPQDDWDKIESMPVTELKKNKENIIGPMDIEPFYVEDNEYTVNHPRRSSRKRELKINDVNNLNTNNNSLVDKEILKGSSGEMDKKLANTKQNWNNVKKMRKEFSKLNKKNRNKLNVSIEMCKKTQSTAKPNTALKHADTPQVLEIDENTPKLTLNDLPVIEMVKVASPNHSDYDEIIYSKDTPKDSLQNTKPDGNDNLLDQINMSQSVMDHAEGISIHRNQVMKTNLLNQPKPVNEKQAKMPFYKKSALCLPDVTQQSQDQGQKEGNSMKTVNHNIESNSDSNDDIEITIKVGSTITNIVIKKKKDVQVKVNTDREVQTSSIDTSSQRVDTRNASINIDSNNEVIIEHKQISQDIIKQVSAEHTTPELKKLESSLKSASAKKNTASADTGTGQFQITDSVEKELSDIMECAEVQEQEKAKSVPLISEKGPRSITLKPQSNPETVSQKKNTPKPKTQPLKDTKRITPNPEEEDELSYLNDLDIFESDTVKETNVQLLKYGKNTTPSEILICTAHNRNKTQKTNEKRVRGDANEGLPANKKQKLSKKDTSEVNKTADLSKQSKQNQPDSESPNYDCVMGQVFASIDADMEEIKSQNIISQKLGNINRNVSRNTNKSTQGKTQSKSTQNIVGGTQKQDGLECMLDDFHVQKYSENLFSVYVEKEDEVEPSAPKIDQVQHGEPEPIIDDFLTPVMGRNNQLTGALVESQVIEIVNDDSESVVEDTPQKNTSFVKIKPKSTTASNHNSPRNATKSKVPSESSVSEQTKSVVNLLDTSEIKSANNVTIIDTRKTNLETPLTINKFVNHIQHNSTPVARKSLNFDSENIGDDLEQTLCPTSDAVAKTTQEKEFMRKAFEKTPATQDKPLSRNIGRSKQFCIAGSCLSVGEVLKLKELCSMYKWSYTDKYTRDLTHLVVGVDEENKSQRSVKYMRALAASKWIVSYEWVEKCLESKKVVGEEMYEALDSTGEPGPRRSRVSNKKLFQGITFFCMGPFSILDMDSLKEILEASGGMVVPEVKDVRVTDQSAPAMLLADPENTQEDRFIYLAMKLSIVPVNFEWVLNCLGNYNLCSVQDLLLCPSSLLPKATAKWPKELMARDDD